MLDIRETTWNKAHYVYLYSGTDLSQGFFNMASTQLQCTTPEETRIAQLQLKTPTFETSAALRTASELGAEPSVGLMLEFPGYLVATDTRAVTITWMDCFWHIQPALLTELVVKSFEQSLLTLRASRAAVPAPDLT